MTAVPTADIREVLETQPDVDWHKGRAVQFLLRRLDLDGPEEVADLLDRLAARTGPVRSRGRPSSKMDP